MPFLRFFKVILTAEIIVPFIFVLIYITFLAFLRGSLPSTEEIFEHAYSLYDRFGYEVVFLGSLLESLVLVNFFVPGGIAAGLGAVFARTGDLNLNLVVLSTILGASIGYIIDYILGSLGFGRIIKKLGYGALLNKAREQIEKSAIKTFGLGFFNFGVGSLLSLASGAAKLKFFRFLTLFFLSTTLWVSFWGILIFATGEVIITLLVKYTWILVLLVVSVWILITFYNNSKK